MKIVFVNLHTNGNLVKTAQQMITGIHPMSKHKFLVEYMTAKKAEVVDYITLDGTTIPGVSKIRSLILRKLEAKIVFRKNGFPGNSIKLITDSSMIDQDDIVICRSTNTPAQVDPLANINAIKIVDHIHFYGEEKMAKSLKDKGLQYYTFEVDLNKYSKLYQKNYAWFNGKYIMKPYSFQPRFIVKRDFSSRKTKALAMGTLTKCHLPDFFETYGTEYYQPHRKMIMDNAGKYVEELDSYISEYQEEPLKIINDNDLKIVKLMKNISNFFKSGQQKSYFSFDMVDKYNEYKMFICPEDINGSYGIGTIEGMACGCAMIGWDYGAFEDMGMISGKHYISYDGTMEDLVAKIRYYQKPENQEELEMIAKTGCEFVRRNFSEEAVAKKFYEELVGINGMR